MASQRLEKKLADLYAERKPADFCGRKPAWQGMGRKVGNTYSKNREVVIVEAARTPCGRAGGILKDFKAVELGALAIKEVLRRTADRVKPEDVDYVFMGHVVPAGCGQVTSRQASILAGLPESVPSITINKVCSSGIKTIDLAAQMIQVGRAEIVIAGGMESMTHIPYSLPEMRWGVRMGVPPQGVGIPSRPAVDLMVNDGLWCAFYNRHMAIHGSEVANEFGFTREDQDEWAYHTQMAAAAAMAAGRLEDETFEVEVRDGRQTVILNKDEGPRASTTMEALAKLPPVFGHTMHGRPGSVTAGNAPGVNDGGDACMLMSGEKAAELGLKPICTIMDYAEVSQDPKDIATVPGLSIKKVLGQNNLAVDELELIEINEAFAAVVLVSARVILGMSREEMFKKVNVNGGAVAYGHPIGATGARIVMTLAYELRRRGGGLGAVGICSGAAQGDAMLIRVEP